MDTAEVRARLENIKRLVAQGENEAADAQVASLHSDVLFAIADDTSCEMSPSYVRLLAWLAYSVRDLA